MVTRDVHGTKNGELLQPGRGFLGIRRNFEGGAEQPSFAEIDEMAVTLTYL
jgi:hypothetical protein